MQRPRLTTTVCTSITPHMKNLMKNKQLMFFASIICLASQNSPAKADSYEYGEWAYNCMHDHKDPYGDVLNPRNCWASVCPKGVWEGGCVTIFHFTKDRDRVGNIGPHQACEYTPSKMAVDGQRIDLLSDQEQIDAILKGKSLTLEVWDYKGKGSWPYCYTADRTISLKGSSEVYKRLMKMKPKYLPGE